MHTVYLLLGGNLGDRESNLSEALLRLNRAGRVVAVSALRETEPWGFETRVPAFLNQAVCLETELDPESLLAVCLDIEKELGRIRASGQSNKETHRKYASRPIDIDILLYDHLFYHSENLDIPHKRLPERPFAIGLIEEIFPKNVSLTDFYPR